MERQIWRRELSERSSTRPAAAAAVRDVTLPAALRRQTTQQLCNVAADSLLCVYQVTYKVNAETTLI